MIHAFEGLEIDQGRPVVNNPTHLPQANDCEEHADTGSSRYLQVCGYGVDHGCPSPYLW